MKLIALDIENFGKLHRYKLDLRGGLNTVCEENGWGKSTLAAFIKAMFYGLPKSTRRNLDENERQKYAPWQGGTYGGNLIFECTHGKFRLERTFGEPDTFALYDLSTGLPSAAFSEAVGQELFGIDADGFERSTYLSARALLPSGKNDTVHAKLTGVLDDVNDMANFEKALGILEDRAREYKKTGGRGRIGELDARIGETTADLRQRRAYLTEQQQKEDALAKVRQELENVSTRLEEIRKVAVLAEQMDEKQRRERDIQQLETQRNTILGSFSGGMPTAEELAVQHDLLRKIEIGNAEIRAMGLDAREQAELVRLSGLFPTGAPDETVLEERLRQTTALRDDKIRHSTELDLAQRDLTEAEEKTRKYPPETEIRETIARLDAVPSPSGERTALPKILLAAALIFSMIGIAGLIWGVLQSRLPFTVAGGALLVAGLFCLLFSRFGIAKSSRPDPKTNRDALAAARELLARSDLPAGDDPRRALLSLLDSAAQAQKRYADAQERIESLHRSEAGLRARESDLRAFLSGYGIAESDPETGLRRLAENGKSWSRLLQKQREAERQLGEKRALLQTEAEQASRFFARCSALSENADFEVRMREIERLTALEKNLSERIAQQRETLRALIAEKHLDGASAVADPTALSVQKDQLEQRQTALREEERGLALLVDRLNRETEQIPETEESLLRMKQEYDDLTERHRLLQLTCKYLKESREALTTRYLGGTRKSFERYLTMLAGDDAPEADVNAELGVTVLDSGRSRPTEAYSRGWRDILQFCVRLSLVDALYADSETPFLLLDDPFTNLDETRLAAAKRLLATLAERYQILYLVCHGDRA